jgi:cellulose synthase (UDP-forming)
MLSLALLILLDAPRPSPYEWFDIKRVANIRPRTADSEGATHWGTTAMISEVGAEVTLTKAGHVLPESWRSQAVDLALVDEQLVLPAIVTQARIEDGLPTFTLQFESLSLPQQRQLTELLFCRPGQWQSRCSPNELQSLWLILKSVFRPRFLFDRRDAPKPVMVSKG